MRARQALTRADLIRGRSRAKEQPARPPWAQADPAFLRLCTGCGDCVEACPEGILVSGTKAFPEIDFRRGECTFCGACAESCAAGALRAARDDAPEMPWLARVRVGDACLSARGVVCRICAEQCDARAIRFADPRGLGRPLVDPGPCTGCGACVAPCPAGAVSVRVQPVSEEEVRG